MSADFLDKLCKDLNRENLERWYGEDTTSDFYEDLKDAAWNVLHDNPGCDRQDWIDTLIRQYPTEVVDALGTDPYDVHAQLSDLWDMEYEDSETGLCERYRDWAEYFVTERTVELYDILKEKFSRANLVHK